MKAYQKNLSSLTKLLLGITIFILAMTITFSEVSGVPYNYSNTYNSDDAQPQGDDSYAASPQYYSRDVLYNEDSDNPIISFESSHLIEDPTITAIPEPGTIFLLMAGLGVLRAANRKNK